MHLSDDEAAALDEWMAEIEAYLRRIDDPVCWPQMQPYALTLRQALVALQVACRRADHVVPIYRITDLALDHAKAQQAEGELWIEALYERLAAEEAYSLEMDRLLNDRDRTEDARLEALKEARARRKRETDEKIASLRPEFERLREQVRSARRPAELLGERTGYNPETIRKQLR